MHTTASLKAKHKTLATAKNAHKLKAASWQALADKLNGVTPPTKAKKLGIAELKSTIKVLQQQVEKLEAKNAAINQRLIVAQKNNSKYFISPEAEIVYNIVELDGEQRLKALGVNRTHYRDAKKAKEWRNNLAMKIHPDKCTHSFAARAMDEITAIYENMVAA
jgi:cell division protein FtsB